MDLFDTIGHQVAVVPVDHVHALGCGIQHLPRTDQHRWTAACICQHCCTGGNVLSVMNGGRVFVQVVQPLRSCSDVRARGGILQPLLRIVGDVRMVFGLVVVTTVDVPIAAIGTGDEVFVFDRLTTFVPAVVLELPWQRVGPGKRYLRISE